MRPLFGPHLLKVDPHAPCHTNSADWAIIDPPPITGYTYTKMAAWDQDNVGGIILQTYTAPRSSNDDILDDILDDIRDDIRDDNRDGIGPCARVLHINGAGYSLAFDRPPLGLASHLH